MKTQGIRYVTDYGLLEKQERKIHKVMYTIHKYIEYII